MKRFQGARGAVISKKVVWETRIETITSAAVSVFCHRFRGFIVVFERKCKLIIRAVQQKFVWVETLAKKRDKTKVTRDS